MSHIILKERKKLGFITAILLLSNLPAMAAPPTSEYMLSNGLKLIVREDHRAPVVFSSVWYKVGSSYEYSGITGISHALEHMMFRGTHRFGPGELFRLMNLNGGEQNAETGTDYTIYYQKLPSQKLSLSFELEADRMQNLLLAQDAFSKEIQVVMEERRMRTEDDPQQMTLERFNAAANINSPDHHPVVGWMSDLQQLTIDDLRRWYHQWYGPNNAVLVIVGDVKPQAVLALAQKYFGPVKPIPLPIKKQHWEIPNLPYRSVTVRIPAQLPWVLLGYNVPSISSPKKFQESYVLTVLSSLLSEGASARLQQDLVRHQQIATDVGANYDQFRLFDSLLMLYATPSPQHTVADLKEALVKELQNLIDETIPPDELQRIKAQIIAEHIYDQDSLENQARDLGVPEMIGFSWRESDRFVDRIKAVTGQQIQAVAKEYFTTNRLTTSTLLPTGKQ